jgi:hypothetical protein
MRFLADPSIERGRVVIVKDGSVIAMAPSVETRAIVTYALTVGDELRAHPDAMWRVPAWIRGEAKRRAQK